MKGIDLKNLEAIARKTLSSGLLEPEEISVITAVDDNDFSELLFWANRIRRHFFGRKISFCCIAPGRRGGCSEDCAWCGQSAHYHALDSPVRPVELEDLVLAAKKAQNGQAACFCVVVPRRRPTEQDIRLTSNDFMTYRVFISAANHYIRVRPFKNGFAITPPEGNNED